MAKKVKTEAIPKPIDSVRMTECVRAIKSREQTIKELDKEIDKYKAEIKGVMASHNLSEMECDVFTVRFKRVNNMKFDAKAFKANHRALYEKYLKFSSSTRFTID